MNAEVADQNLRIQIRDIRIHPRLSFDRTIRIAYDKDTKPCF